jgi:hypothetical protein
MHRDFLSENLKGRDHAEEVSVDGKIIGLREIEWKMWTE